MVTLLDAVCQALTDEGLNVRYAHSEEINLLPVVILRESINRTAAQADGDAYLKELEYTVEARDHLLSDVCTAGETVDAALTGMNFRKTGAQLTRGEDGRSASLLMRYGAYADADGNVYTHV